jgi:hypothetical protein
MSAWRCTDTHLRVLALAALNFRREDLAPQPGKKASDEVQRINTIIELCSGVFKELRRTNSRSLTHRYGDEPDRSSVNHSPTEWRKAARWLDYPAAVVRLVECYQYQACEHLGGLEACGNDAQKERGWNLSHWAASHMATRMANYAERRAADAERRPLPWGIGDEAPNPDLEPFRVPPPA